MTKTVRFFEKGSVFADYFMENTPQNVVCGTLDADLGVIMPGYDKKAEGKFGILLIPDGCDIYHNAEKVITYGMASHNALTLSSVGENRCVLTIQREIVTVFGKTLEPQDVVIPRLHLEPQCALAASAALLIAGGVI